MQKYQLLIYGSYYIQLVDKEWDKIDKKEGVKRERGRKKKEKREG